MIRLTGTTKKDNEILLFYAYTKATKNFFKFITSKDGFEFNGNSKYVIVTDSKGREEPKYDWGRFNISKQKDQYVATYKTNSTTFKNLSVAVSKDLLRWQKLGKIDNIKEVGAIVPDYKDKHRYVMYFGEKDIRLAYSSQFENWKPLDKPILVSRKGFFDDGDLEVAGVINQEETLLLVYYAKTKKGDKITYATGAALLDKKDPTQIIWRSEKPLWEQPAHLQSEKIYPLNVEPFKDALILYWQVGDGNIYAVSCQLPNLHTIKDKDVQILLKRSHKNPIISPEPKNRWESRATFNTAALYEDGKVHFVYRALGDTDLSVFGYATSEDGVTIDERSEEPCYFPREPFETPGGHAFDNFADHFASGGGYGGVEDPRITKVDDMIYLTYVAFDGWSPPRVALSSIPLDDFLKKNWKVWAKPKLISPPGMVNKNAVIFPEKINGKYMVIHRVYPNILIDVVDDLNFDDKYLTGHYFIPPRKGHWDSKKIGAGAPPILTKDGWLFIYQSVGYQDPGRYKIGAMVLDKDDPTKVLYRANNPIVSPEADYENAGFKAGVVYPCGAVIKDDNLFVYYGGADTVVCAATENIDTFLTKMKQNKEPKLKRVTSPILN